MEKKYLDFLHQGNKELEAHDKTLKRGVVHKIHLAEDALENLEFIGLSDTPAVYTDQAGRFLVVNDGETALLFRLINASDVQPGTFPSGAYVFQGVVSGVTPTLSAHLATKEYVDLAANVEFDYFLTNTAHAIGGIYYEMHDQETGDAESSLSTGPLGGGADQALVNFANVSGEPGIHALQSGVFGCHFHAERTAGTRSVRIYWELYKRTDPGGVETLLMTSEVSGLITSKTGIDLHAAIATETDLDATDILVVKFYANLGNGSPTTIVLYAEGTSDSHFTIPVESSIFNQIYLRQDGTLPLTANWNAGAFSITAQALIGANVTSGVDPGHSHTNASLATKTTAAWNKTIGSGGDYADWATMIAAMPDLIDHEVTITIKTGTILTEICDIQNKHGISTGGEISVKAEIYLADAPPTADGASATTLNDTDVFDTNDEYNNCWVLIVDGTGTDNGFVAITDTTGGVTNTITVASWPGTEPDNTSKYIIVGALIDCQGTQDYGFDIRYCTIPIALFGIGVESCDLYSFYSTGNERVRAFSCGAYDGDLEGFYIEKNTHFLANKCGIVNCNTNNSGAHAGILIISTISGDVRFSGISDNGRYGIQARDGGSTLLTNNFGDGNGVWGSYAKWAAQVRISGTECSGSGGNHSDEGTAGNNSADQAATY